MSQKCRRSNLAILSVGKYITTDIHSEEIIDKTN